MSKDDDIKTDNLRRTAHEMNNILTLLTGSIKLIKRDHPEVADFKYWDTIEGDLDELVKLAVQFFSSAKDNSRFDCNDIRSLVFEMKDIFEDMCTDKCVSIVILIDEDEETISRRVNTEKTQKAEERVIENASKDAYSMCFFDYSAMKLALINLIKNACEACFNDTEIKLSLGRHVKGEQRYTFVKVSDCGETIDESEIKLIFEENYTTKSNGTGQGLPFVKNTARENGGFVTVYSKEGITEFTIYIPDSYKKNKDM